MSNKISRRSFLKCAGATALAAGAASMLSGCDLIGAAMNLGFEKIGNQMGHASATMGDNVWAALSNRFCSWNSGENELLVLAVEFQVKNKRSEGLTFHASDITDVKINGHKARVVVNPGTEFSDCGNQENYPVLYDASGNKTFAASPDMNAAENGYIYFAPVYDEGEEHITGTWETVKFTFKLNGNTATFTGTHNADNTMTSAKE